jgi:hypothetical protein
MRTTSPLRFPTQYVFEKGFLLPFGTPVPLIIVTEPMFLPSSQPFDSSSVFHTFSFRRPNNTLQNESRSPLHPPRQCALPDTVGTRKLCAPKGQTDDNLCRTQNQGQRHRHDRASFKEHKPRANPAGATARAGDLVA